MILKGKLILNRKELIKFTNNSLLKRSGNLLSYFDINALNHSMKNNKYLEVLKNNFYLFQDGIGMYTLLKNCKKDIDRIVSTDYYHYLIKKLKREKVNIFLIGYNYDKDLVTKKAKEKQLNLSGYYNGYFYKNESAEIAELIRRSNAEYIFIGMGKPKQEFVAYELKKYIPNVNYVCVGDFFNYYFGLKKRAPAVLKKLGLEWTYRLLKEPKRLRGRYVNGIIQVLYHTYSLRISMKKNRGHFNDQQNNFYNMLYSLICQ